MDNVDNKEYRITEEDIRNLKSQLPTPDEFRKLVKEGGKQNATDILYKELEKTGLVRPFLQFVLAQSIRDKIKAYWRGLWIGIVLGFVVASLIYLF